VFSLPNYKKLYPEICSSYRRPVYPIAKENFKSFFLTTTYLSRLQTGYYWWHSAGTAQFGVNHVEGPIHSKLNCAV